MTPKQEKELAQKHALVEKIQRLEAAGYQPAQIKKMLKLGNQAAPSEMLGLEAVPLSGTGDAGYCSMSIWKEPESQPNWCGPGSGEAVISNWRTVPPSGYADATAYMTYLATQMMSGNTTTVSTWILSSTTRSAGTYYEKASLTGLADYENKLTFDIYYVSHPVNHLIRTTNLPGWGGYSCNHYVQPGTTSFRLTKSTMETQHPTVRMETARPILMVGTVCRLALSTASWPCKWRYPYNHVVGMA